MAVGPDRPQLASLLETLSKGRALPQESAQAIERLIGVRPGLEGLSSLFQPGFPGIQTFAVDVHATPDQAVELWLVGISRDGRPVWSGPRAFTFGRDGSLEIHRGFDEIDPDYQSRNITVDLMQREMDLLLTLGRGRASRLTIDADGVGRYVCALHGFVFADESEEGPPVRSRRSLDPTGDRAALCEAAQEFIERFGARKGVGRIAIEEARADALRAERPFDFACLGFPGRPNPFADSDEGAMGVTDLGRELLLAKDTPGWRAAAYVYPTDKRAAALGAEYRRRKTRRSEARLAEEIQAARDTLHDAQRATRVRALETLGRIAPSWLAPELRPITEGADRRVAAVARQTLRKIAGSGLADRMLAFANDTKQDARFRALAYRVLAEHYPDKLRPSAARLRVDPDARIQRAVVPLVAYGFDQAQALASMLSANPWTETEKARPGLLALRLELIDRIRTRADPVALPSLLAAFRSATAPPPAETLALSRALVSFSDPRAQTVLNEAVRRMGRPEIP